MVVTIATSESENVVNYQISRQPRDIETMTLEMLTTDKLLTELQLRLREITSSDSPVGGES